MIHTIFLFLLCGVVAVLTPGYFLYAYAPIRNIFNESIATHTQKNWYGLCEEYGASTIEDFYRHVSNDAALQRYYHDFDWSNARIITSRVDFFAHVAYTPLVTSIHGEFPWSRKPALLRRGESFITDRAHAWDESSGWLVRSWCCNPVSVGNVPPQSYPPDEPPGIYLPPPIYDIQPPNRVIDNTPPTPPQEANPPQLLTTAMFNPPHILHVSNPPEDACVFRPDVVVPSCLPASFPEKARIACGKNGKPFRIPVCETTTPPKTPTLERVVLPTPEPSTWILFGSMAIVVLVLKRGKWGKP